MDRAPVVWLTGLPASGKSTIASALASTLAAKGRPAAVFDGDAIRRSMSRDLGFSRADRNEQVRRVVALADDAARAGVVAIVALVSPYRAARDSARVRLAPFVEVFVDCPLPTLVERDPKGLYREALAGRIAHFTGVSDPYEPPLAPELHVRSDRESVVEAVERIRAFLDALETRPA